MNSLALFEGKIKITISQPCFFINAFAQDFLMLANVSQVNDVAHGHHVYIFNRITM